MATKLLDTTFLIHYLAGRDSVETYLEAHEETAGYLTTTINLKEIAVGKTLRGGLDRAAIEATFDWVQVVPFLPEHAYAAAGLEADLHRDDGTSQTEMNALAGDVLIAAVAVEEGATVVTKNVRDFERLGVPVESY